MKKLPELYKNNDMHPKNNNKKVCYLNNEEVRNNSKTDILQELDSIFNSLGYSYNIPIIIETKNDKIHTSLVTKSKNYVITIDNQTIPISDIINIEKE